MNPNMDVAPGAEILAAASGVGVGEDAEPDEAPAESEDPEETDEVESWLPPLVLEESVIVAVLEVAVLVDSVLVDVPIKVVAAAE